MEKNNQIINQNQYKELADTGDVNAMLEYCKILFNDKPEEAVKYLKKAIEKNSTEGMRVYAHCLWGGVGVEGNLEEAEKYFKLAIETETDEYKKAYIKSDLATMLYSNKRKKEALKYYKEAIDGGYTRDIKNFVFLLNKGFDDDKMSRQEKLKYYKTAIDLNKGGEYIKYNYAELLYNYGKGSEEELEEAEKYFKKAMNEGNPHAVYAYANLKGESKQFVTDSLFDLFETYKTAGKAEKEVFVLNLK